MNAAEGQRTALGRDEGREFALGPVSRVPETLGYEVYGMLLDGLIEGRIRPGDRLIMDRLANELDVSRTPVRDALQRLYREGVIEPAGRRGYLVREQSALDIRDFYLARMAIEGAAAAAIALSESSVLDGVRGLLDEITEFKPGSTKESFDVNRRFHRGMVVASDNSYLVDMFDTIWNRSRTALTYRQFASSGAYEDFRGDHERLLDAIDGADPESARRSMIDHIQSGLSRTQHDVEQVSEEDR
ncbi:MAG: GntR family transcriptional regulator [Nocardioidaceae bacterium]|nr:MAG: GntR family transcriptional regulator [Nocardioidaceae bacterium]